MLGKDFTARERTRKVAISQNQEIKRTETGYSCRKWHLHERRVAEDQSGLSAFERLTQQAEDDDTYDTEADKESEKLEGTIKREKSSQTKWKAAHRKATEACENRTIVSHRE